MQLTHWKALLVTGALSVGMGLPAYADNLLPNPDFATNTDGWSISLEFSGARFELDTKDGSPAAPSAVLVPGPGVNDAVSDCIPVTVGRYDLFVNLKPGLNDARVRAALIAFSDASCTTYVSALAYTQQTDVALSSGWYQQSARNFMLPDDTQGVRVALSNNTSDPIHFDHVRFGPAGTTSVTLQSFNVD